MNCPYCHTPLLIVSEGRYQLAEKKDKLNFCIICEIYPFDRATQAQAECAVDEAWERNWGGK